MGLVVLMGRVVLWDLENLAVPLVPEVYLDLVVPMGQEVLWVQEPQVVLSVLVEFLGQAAHLDQEAR